MTLLILAVAVEAAEPLAVLPARNDAVWLALGGVVGALARALWTRGQRNFGWETAQDCFLGAAVGLLWTVPIEPLSVVWPPFELSEKASTLQRAGLVAVFVCVTVELLKQALIRWAPAYMARFAGSVAPAPPPDGSSAAPKP